MLTVVPLISTAPSKTASAMSSYTGKLWGHRMSGILQYSGWVETCNKNSTNYPLYIIVPVTCVQPVSSQTDSQGDGPYPRHPRAQRLHPQTGPLDQDAEVLFPGGHRVH